MLASCPAVIPSARFVVWLELVPSPRMKALRSCVAYAEASLSSHNVQRMPAALNHELCSLDMQCLHNLRGGFPCFLSENTAELTRTEASSLRQVLHDQRSA